MNISIKYLSFFTLFVVVSRVWGSEQPYTDGASFVTQMFDHFQDDSLKKQAIRAFKDKTEKELQGYNDMLINPDTAVKERGLLNFISMLQEGCKQQNGEKIERMQNEQRARVQEIREKARRSRCGWIVATSLTTCVFGVAWVVSGAIVPCQFP